MIAVGSAGCRRPAPTEDGPPPAATPPPGSASPAGPPPAAPPPGHVPRIHYQPVGLSDLYARFFADEAAMTGLAEDLGRELTADSVALEVRWDEADKSGTITLYVPETDTRGERLADAVAAGAPLDMEATSRLMGTIGRYRERLGGRYDLRILSFHLRLSFWDARLGSACTIRGEVGDPEGRLVGPCFDCLDPRAEGGHVQACREVEAWPATLAAQPAVLRRVESALRSNPP